MKFEAVKFYNFRNIDNNIVSFDGDDIILEGVNGQGKSNILESLYTLCYGSSFRTNNIKDLIKIKEKELSLNALLYDGDRKYHLSYIIKNGKRRIILNDKEVKDRKELIYNFPCIVFTHEDINFIKGEPEYRRRFFDQTMSMYDPIYLDNIRKYRSILEQRNAAIKNNKIYLLDVYNERIAKYALDIIKDRKNLIKEFNEIFPALYKKISKSDKSLNITYSSSFDIFDNENGVCKYLKDNEERDIKLQTTTSGPHRDRFVVNDENGPFAITGSTGQIRLASLLFRVCEAKFFIKKTNKKPILLLDDVLLELDSEKRGLFLDELTDYNQAFYTFLPREKYFNERSKNIIKYNIKDGRIERR